MTNERQGIKKAKEKKEKEGPAFIGRRPRKPKTVRETQDVRHKINTGCLWGGD